jgi:hypothetical protein
MTSEEASRELESLAGQLERLFDDELWSERAESGTDRDDDTNPQQLIGCAIDDLIGAARNLRASAPTTPHIGSPTARMGRRDA